MKKINDFIYNVGVEDLNGCFYNAYLILDEKNILIDGVPKELEEQYFQNIEEVTAFSDIDSVIYNHCEPDCSGCLDTLLKKQPTIKVIASVSGLRNLKEILNRPFCEQLAKNQGQYSIGKRTLHFIITPQLNWPDSMITWIDEDHILFSGDLFSTTCIEKQSKCEALTEYMEQNFLYFPEYCYTALQKIKDIQPSMICPHLGSMIQETEAAIQCYQTILGQKSIKKQSVSIFYVSYYGYTKEMAKIAENLFKEKEYQVRLVDLNTEDGATYLNQSEILLFGTPTIHKKAPKEMWNLLGEMNCTINKDRKALVFGSYGWSGEGCNLVYTMLEQMRLKPFSKPFVSILKLSDEKREEWVQYINRFIRYCEE